MWEFPLTPEQASTIAPNIDLLFWVITAVSAVFTVGVATAIIYFAVKYRRGSQADRSRPIHTSLKLELAWSVGPFLLSLVFFFWAAAAYFQMYRVPTRSGIEINVVGKQWMWKIQHPNGRREINTLHVPVGQPVKLSLTSQDVIHAFYVPAFRIKRDVLPGRISTAWFEATKTGTYHLFCAEYCGTEHSRMIGSVVVMEPEDYEEWLTHGNAAQETPAQAGERLFNSYGCATCHARTSTFRAPKLEGLFGTQVQVKTAAGEVETVTVDEQYLRESIHNSQARVVVGYDPVMPVYRNQIGDEEVLQLIAYIKSLASTEGTAP
jgi:cytochrome c oxidase subunit 2